MSSFININNRTVENESKYSATVIKNALLRTETKSSIKANKLVENITEPVSLNEALSVFTDKLRAVSALSESYKEAVATEIMEFNASKEELTLNEGTMSDIHQLANEVKDISSFVKEFFKQFGDKIKKSADSIQWVESLYTDMKTESVVTEAVNNKAYVKAGKLGYNDQFLARRSLSWTLSVDLGLKASDEFVGPWLGFDHVSMYAIGKNGGTILDDALTGKYTYDELKAAASDFLGIKESTDTELNEARSISKIQKDWSETTTKMSQKVIDWKEAEGDRKTELLDELKALTKRKSELEAELDDKVAGKDKDLALVISEDHSENPNDKYEVRPCDEEGTPFAVWEGDVRVECFATEEEAQAFADKQNKEQGLDEAKFVKDFNRDVLNAKTEEEVLELYPNAEFFIGKSDHFFGELDDNLFFKAYYTKAQKEFEIKSVYSEKGSNYVHLYNESIVNENYEVIFSDGMSQMKKFRNERQALDFMKKTIASNKKLRDIAVYKPGMHSTTQTELVVKFWGDGSYLDNVSKRDKDLAAKKLEESVVNEDVLCEATVIMDAVNPDDKDFLKFLKKNNVKIIDTVKSGPTGHPEITMQGKRKDLETVLADGEYGWDDPGLAEYIEESVVTKDVEITLDTLVEMFEIVDEGLRSDIKKFIKDNKKELDELADNEEWDLMHQKLYTDFEVEADTAEAKELLKTFELTF